MRTKYQIETSLRMECIAFRIDIPIKWWHPPGTDVCTKLLDNGIIEGMLVEGFWIGPVKMEHVAAQMTIIRHSWIQLDDGYIFDPTRRILLGQPPSIKPCVVENDDHYDATGAKVHKYLGLTSPLYDPNRPTVNITFEEDVKRYVDSLLGYPTAITIDQARWLVSTIHDKHNDEIIHTIICSGLEHLVSREIHDYYYQTDIPDIIQSKKRRLSTTVDRRSRRK